MRASIFYSWQSDLPGKTNRSFIEAALKLAIKELGGDKALLLEVVVDRDTFGLPGAPHIAEAILQKIEKAAVFVVDVSTIGKVPVEGEDGIKHERPMPNPNVCLELGYALRALGQDRIIMVLNKAYGEPEHLPFDLKFRRALCYTSRAADEDRAGPRLALAHALAGAIKPILSHLQTLGEQSSKNLPQLTLKAGNATAEVAKNGHTADKPALTLRWEVSLINLGEASANDISLAVEFDQKSASREGYGSVPPGKWPSSQSTLSDVPPGRMGFFQSYFVNHSFQPRKSEVAVVCYLKLYRHDVGASYSPEPWSIKIQCYAQEGPVAREFSFSAELLKNIYWAAWQGSGLEDALREAKICESWSIKKL